MNNFTRKIIQTQRPDGSSRRREIWVPTAEEREIQADMLEQLHSMRFFFKHAMGAIPGRSLHENIEPHRASYRFYLLDLKDAYANTPVNELLQLLDSRDRKTDWDKELHEHALHPDGKGLIMGAPISPFLFNIALLGLDADISRVIDDRWRQERGRYTRWIDDLTISSAHTLTKYDRTRLREAITEHGLAINPQKTRIHTLARPVTITGVSLYPNRFYQMSPQLIERAGALLDYVEQGLDMLAGAVHEVGAQQTMFDSGNDIVPTRGEKSLVGVLHGAKSIIVSTRDPKRDHDTRVERRLLGRYRRLCARAGSLGLL